MLCEHTVLRRADIRAMHTRTVLRRLYRVTRHGATRSTNALHVVIVSNPAPDANVKDADRERYLRFHSNNQHGR